MRARDPVETAIVTLEKGGIYSYAQCGLPYVIEGAVRSTKQLIARDVSTFREKHGIDARIHTEVTSIDCENKTVTFVTEKQTEETIAYDKLLIASGAKPFIPHLPGNDLPGVHTLKTIPDLEAIQTELAGTKQITIVGTGYIGLEMAEASSPKENKVHMVARSHQLASTFDADMATHLMEEATAQGVNVLFQTNVSALHAGDNGRVHRVETDRGTFDTDLVLFATGIAPNTEFLNDCPIEQHENGAVCVNDYLETTVRDVYAAGDCATQYHRVKKQHDYMPLGTHANKQGRIAGMNMSETEPPRKYPGMVGTAVFRFFNLTAAMTGLTEQAARDLNLDIETVTYDGTHIAGYFENKMPLHVKLVYDRKSDQLYGAQAIGAGADKRIDVAATALYQELTCRDLEDLDLSYAPPYNGVWDPLQQAARRRKRY
ncbi:LOW QUALITY PROTEIN: pyridine nucleotide-disulfide oxidoreductase [Geomicrobium sp. JCM 19037]|nr:LOW QUALITY PROTEIN: pyridine nucleotide-disulfide oxidoreductase [Geomicrobium sp. JCM 19037]